MEINSRVNYPIKECLNQMAEDGLVDMGVPDVKYYVSFVTLHVAQVGLMMAVDAWNSHRIPGT